MEPIVTYDDEVAAEVRAAVGDGPGPVLVHLVRGFVDAGATAGLLVDHLLAAGEPRRLATFDLDSMYDYRARRPTMIFDAGRWTRYDRPELVVDVVRDADSVPYLLAHGLEPDFRWEAYAAAMRDLVDRFLVPQVLTVHGVPMAVPHTRPTTVTAHANEAADPPERSTWFGTVQVPASVSAFLEHRFEEWSLPAGGVAVHVPHYLTQSQFPQASRVAAEHLERLSGLDLRSADLAEAAAAALADVEEQVAQNPEVAAVVAGLEQQYDAFMAGADREGLLAGDLAIPTADELGAQFEQFLAQQPETDGPNP